jgi:hypothetical protein
MGTIAQSLAFPAGMVADQAWVQDVTNLINAAGASMTPTVTTLTATGAIAGNSVAATLGVTAATVTATGAISGALLASTGLISSPGTLNTTGKVLINNNAAATYTVAANISIVRFTGTNAAAVEITLPAAAASIDGLTIQFSSQAGVATLTWVSTGATFNGAPAAFTANTPFALTYFHSTATWELTA